VGEQNSFPFMHWNHSSIGMRQIFPDINEYKKHYSKNYISFFKIKLVPAREMGPRELLKSSSSSFGRAGDWVMNWDSSRPLLILRHAGLGRRVNTGWWGYLRRHSDAQVSKAGG